MRQRFGRGRCADEPHAAPRRRERRHRQHPQSALVYGRLADDEHDLGRENDALRRENQKLRRELVRQKEGDPVIDMTSKKGRQGALSSSVSQEPIVDDGGWWLSSQGKRHNSKCRYYKMGKGRSCGKDDGTPCKKCGG